MKAARFFILSLVLGISFASYAQNRIFQDLPISDGVEKTYISKGMMRLAGSKKISGGGVTIDPAIDKIDGIEVVTIEKKGIIPKAQKILDAYVQENKFEVLLEKSDVDDTTCIYGKPDENGVISMMIIVNNDGEDMNVVVMQGCFTPEDIAKKVRK